MLLGGGGGGGGVRKVGLQRDAQSQNAMIAVLSIDPYASVA